MAADEEMRRRDVVRQEKRGRFIGEGRDHRLLRQNVVGRLLHFGRIGRVDRMPFIISPTAIPSRMSSRMVILPPLFSGMLKKSSSR